MCNPDLETLARMAVRLAGKEPDKHLTIKIGDIVVHDDVTRRYHDYMLRAGAALAILASKDFPAITAELDGGKADDPVGRDGAEAR